MDEKLRMEMRKASLSRLGLYTEDLASLQRHHEKDLFELQARFEEERARLLRIFQEDKLEIQAKIDREKAELDYLEGKRDGLHP